MKYESSYKMLKENPRMDIFYYLYVVRKIGYSDLMNWILKYDLIQILRRLNDSFDEMDLKRAIGYGSIHSVKFLWKKIETEKKGMFEHAIQKHTNYEMMLFLYLKKIPMTNRAFVRAIYLENTECMDWMIQYGFRWNESHLFYAMDHEKKLVIRYFIQHHEVFSEKIYDRLLKGNYIEELNHIEDRLLGRKWNRHYTKLREMKISYLENEFDELYEDSIENEFEKMYQSRRLFDCMTLFSMVPIKDSLDKLLNI